MSEPNGRRKTDAWAVDVEVAAIRKAAYDMAVDECLVVVRRTLANEWKGNDVIRALEKLKK